MPAKMNLALIAAMASLATAQVPCSLWLSPTMRHPLDSKGDKVCKPDGLPMIDKGERCLKTKLMTMVMQTCDDSPGAGSTCAIWGNPTSCCKTDMGAQIICSTTAGFSGAPAASDFAGCETPCVKGGTGGPVPAPVPIPPPAPVPTPPPAPVPTPPPVTAPTPATAGECALWLSPTLPNPAGTVTCLDTGVAMVNKGTQCIKMSVAGMIVQQCDYTPGVNSLCAGFGTPLTCCTTPPGHVGAKASVICSGKDGGFNTAPSTADFAACSTVCTVGTGGDPPIPVPTPAPTNPVFNFQLLLTGITDPSVLTNSPAALEALAAGIAAALNIDAIRVTIEKLWLVLAGTAARRLQATGGQVGITVNVKNDGGDVTPSGLAAAGANMASSINSALQGASIAATVGGVKEQAVAPPVAPPVNPLNPCDVPVQTPAPSNPCAAAAKFSMTDGSGEKMTILHRVSSAMSLPVLGALAFGLGCAALGGVARYVKHSSRKSMQTPEEARTLELDSYNRVPLAEESNGPEAF